MPYINFLLLATASIYKKNKNAVFFDIHSFFCSFTFVLSEQES